MILAEASSQPTKKKKNSGYFFKAAFGPSEINNSSKEIWPP